MNASARAAPGVYGAGRLAGVVPRAMRGLPLEDWVTLGLLVCMFATVAWSLQLADWGNSPTLLPTLVAASAAGLILSRSRVPWPLGHLVSLPPGFAMAMWQATLRADGENVVARGFDVWQRSSEWFEAARTGAVSIDTLPFTLLLLSAAWLVGYSASWSLFRWRSPWAAIILLGLAILTSLSYRMHRFEYTFFYFVVASFALFIHVTTVRRMVLWRSSGTPFPASIRWLAARDALILGPVVVLVAAFLPMWEPQPPAVRGAWVSIQSQFDPLREPASRLLSGITGRDAGPLGSFNTTLPFRGAVRLSDQPVMRVWSGYPTYYLGRVYETYASGGWVNGPTDERVVGPRTGARAPAPPYERLEPVQQRMEPLFNAVGVLPGGLLSEADPEVRVEVLEPLEHEIGLDRDGLDLALPADVREFGERIREVFVDAGTVPEDTRRALALVPSAGLVWRASIGKAGGLVALSVYRASGEPAAQVSARFDTPVAAGDPYSMTVYVSTASDEELQAAGTDYPAWVADRYLQLPESLPRRVRALAEGVVSRADAQTPYEKTLALAGYLSTRVYSQEIHGPERGQDGVDYFLFETVDEPCPSDSPGCDVTRAKGYSQYFGSALTVMLRSVGVPARMAAGFGPGEYVTPAGAYLVRGTDRHGWSQVFFPRYGWIDVEATPGAAAPDRGVPTPYLAPARPLLGIPSGEEDQRLYEEDLENIARLTGLGALAGGGDAADGWPVAPVTGGLAGIAGVLVLALLLWRWGLRGMQPAERAYARVTRLAALLGAGRPAHYTPSEYAALLSETVPSSTRDVARIFARYEAWVYGRADVTLDEERELERGWRRVRGALVRWRLLNLRPRRDARRGPGFAR